MLYLVTQSPKRKYRESLVTVVGVFEADTAAAAKRAALALNEFMPSSDYGALHAAPLELGRAYLY